MYFDHIYIIYIRKNYPIYNYIQSFPSIEIFLPSIFAYSSRAVHILSRSTQPTVPTQRWQLLTKKTDMAYWPANGQVDSFRI